MAASSPVFGFVSAALFSPSSQVLASCHTATSGNTDPHSELKEWHQNEQFFERFYESCADELSHSAIELTSNKANLVNFIAFTGKSLSELNWFLNNNARNQIIEHVNSCLGWCLRSVEEVVRKLTNHSYAQQNRDCLLVLSSVLRSFLPVLLELVQSAEYDAEVELCTSRLFCVLISSCPVSAWLGFLLATIAHENHTVRVKAVEFIAFALLFHDQQQQHTTAVGNKSVSSKSYHSAALDSFSSRVVQSLICAVDDPERSVQSVAYSALLILAVRLGFSHLQPLLIQAQATQEQQNKIRLAYQQYNHSHSTTENQFNGITLLDLNSTSDAIIPRGSELANTQVNSFNGTESTSKIAVDGGEDEEENEDEAADQNDAEYDDDYEAADYDDNEDFLHSSKVRHHESDDEELMAVEQRRGLTAANCVSGDDKCFTKSASNSNQHSNHILNTNNSSLHSESRFTASDPHTWTRSAVDSAHLAPRSSDLHSWSAARVADSSSSASSFHNRTHTNTDFAMPQPSDLDSSYSRVRQTPELGSARPTQPNWNSEQARAVQSTAPVYGRRAGQATAASTSSAQNSSNFCLPNLTRSSSPGHQRSLNSSSPVLSQGVSPQSAHDNSHPNHLATSLNSNSEDEQQIIRTSLPHTRSAHSTRSGNVLHSPKKSAIWLSKESNSMPHPADSSADRSSPLSSAALASSTDSLSNTQSTNANETGAIAAKLRSLKLKSRPTGSASSKGHCQQQHHQPHSSSISSTHNPRAASAFVRRDIGVVPHDLPTTYDNSSSSSAMSRAVSSPIRSGRNHFTSGSSYHQLLSSNDSELTNLSPRSNDSHSINGDEEYAISPALSEYSSSSFRARPVPPAISTTAPALKSRYGNTSTGLTPHSSSPSAHHQPPSASAASGSVSGLKARSMRSQSLAINAFQSNSSSTSSADDTRYLSFSELQPFDSPQDALKTALKTVKSNDWQLRFDSLNSLRRLNANHPEALTPQVKSLLRDVRTEVDSLRSSLARNSLLLLTEMFQLQAKALEAELEFILPAVLKRSGESNAFLAEEANKCLTNAAQYCNEIKSLNSFMNVAATATKVVKQQSILFIDQIIQAHANRLVQQAQQQQFFTNSTSSQDSNETNWTNPSSKITQLDFGRVLRCLSHFCCEAAVISRQAAKQSLIRLARIIGLQELEKSLKKLLQPSQLATVKKMLEKESSIDSPADFHQTASIVPPSHSRVNSAMKLSVTQAGSAIGKRTKSVRNDSNDFDFPSISSASSNRIQSAAVSRPQYSQTPTAARHRSVQ